MNNQEIVAKLWALCNVLRDDGITYHQYVTELTYILFLKMAKETNSEGEIPEAYRWDTLVSKDGIELKKFYKELLEHLGEQCRGRIQEIYAGAKSNIEEPKNLEKIIKTIDALDWYSAKEEGLGNLYEGLLEKNANEKKSGAGQYFTPRVLIDVMTELTNPQAGERCNDPACGTFGFMIAADRYIKDQTDDLFSLSQEVQEFQINEAFSGGERATRDDLTFPTSNKQLNFLQHIYRSLKKGGRAAVVLPDNVLFVDGDGERIRKDLMEKCNLHTILRLPTGIFYAQGVKTNVLFFERGLSDKGNTQEIWFYDLRSNMPNFGKTNPLKREHFDEFVQCYQRDDRRKRQETYSEENPQGRWRRYTYEEICARDKTSLDLSWIRQGEETEEIPLNELIATMEEKAAKITEAIAQLKAIMGNE